MSTSRGPVQFNQGLRPFFELPDHIKPPPGFPFVVLSADPVTDAPKAERRKLAENVVCMFSEDREPIVNMRWRGRYPPNVDRRYNWGRDWDRLHPGDYCMVWERHKHLRASSKNHGVLVRVQGLDKGYGAIWLVEAVGRLIHTHWASDPDNPEGHQFSRTATFHESRLRRCKPPEQLIGLAVK